MQYTHGYTWKEPVSNQECAQTINKEHKSSACETTVTLKKVHALCEPATLVVVIEVGVVACGVIPCLTFSIARDFRTADKHNYFVAAESRSVAYAAKSIRKDQCTDMGGSLRELLGHNRFCLAAWRGLIRDTSRRVLCCLLSLERVNEQFFKQSRTINSSVSSDSNLQPCPFLSRNRERREKVESSRAR